MYKDTKPMLDAKEQIQHLQDKGIKFEIKSRKEAEIYLQSNNNYFKLASYRKNFPKYEQGNKKGKYIDLDFEMLVDLAIIDMRLRKTLLSIVLDLEHYTKIKLLNIVETTTKDGYSFVKDYIQNLKDKGEDKLLESELNKNIKNTYCGDLVKKYNGEYPIWVFVEIISFGRLIKFYMFVANKLNNKTMIDEAYLLKNVRELRNACAHNNCILNDLNYGTSKYKTNYGISKAISKVGIPRTTIGKRMSNARMQQIITLLYLNKRITTSNGVLKYQTDMLKDLENRMNRNIGYYSKNSLIISNFNFLNKIVDNWYNNSI